MFFFRRLKKYAFKLLLCIIIKQSGGELRDINDVQFYFQTFFELNNYCIWYRL